MPKLYVEKTITVNVSLDRVHETVAHFENWIAWSPWLLMEPSAQLEFGKNPEFYSWEGERVGAGNMTVLSEQRTANCATISYALNFLKPWKSYADVKFILKAIDDKTTYITWTMDSSLPFFLFWMKKMTISFIGMDYQRGLRMLKEQLETGTINSSIEFLGESSVSETAYVGIKTQCSFDDINTAMEKDFETLASYFSDKNGLVNGSMFSIYHNWNVSKQLCNYTAAIPVKQILKGLPSSMFVAKRQQQKVYSLRHIGSYEHLGNAWTTLYTMQRNKEFNCVKGAHPFEIYVSNPDDVSAAELITELKFPIQ